MPREENDYNEAAKMYDEQQRKRPAYYLFDTVLEGGMDF